MNNRGGKTHAYVRIGGGGMKMYGVQQGGGSKSGVFCVRNIWMAPIITDQILVITTDQILVIIADRIVVVNQICDQ